MSDKRALEAIRVEITAFTASFRVPPFVSHQVTLPVPPFSTVYGLLSAAKGEIVKPHEVEWMAYSLHSEGVAEDLEAIVAFERKEETKIALPKTRNVLRRQFLVFPRLLLYLPREWEETFEYPRYALLLGRTQDVATVESIKHIDLELVEEGEIRDVLVPKELVFQQGIPCTIYNLPVFMSEDPDRRPLGVYIFGVVTRPFKVKAPGWLVRDEETGLVTILYRRKWVEDVIRGAVS